MQTAAEYRGYKATYTEMIDLNGVVDEIKFWVRFDDVVITGRAERMNRTDSVKALRALAWERFVEAIDEFDPAV